MKKHIIFDMDGVIIDSEPEYQKRIKIFMERNGFTITDELSFQICGSNRKDTYELFQENVPDFVMSIIKVVTRSMRSIRLTCGQS